MEYIPKKYKTEDLPISASFESNDGGFQVVLLSKESQLNPHSGIHEHVPGTGLVVKFKGYKLQTRNSEIMRLLMKSDDFANGKIRIDPEDPSGFWRQAGKVKQKMVPIYVPGPDASGVKFEDIDLKKITKPEKDPPQLVKLG